jgi:hypothetical protein
MSEFTLTAETASSFTRVVLAGIGREYPNKLDHVMNGPEDVRGPRDLHPAFYGCFDWHSAVHGHWVLARLLRLFVSLPEAGAMRAALAGNLTKAAIAGEAAYLRRAGTGSFERTYGWAWLLKLAEELRLLGEFGEVVAPLAEAFVERYLRYLPKLTYPIRTGVHANTAFGLAFAHDYARAVAHGELAELVEASANRFFAADADYPAWLEPGGADFFSPALMEAELMRRVLEPADFAEWLEYFLPRPRFEPAVVSDRGDLQIVHLDGLNLSRAWCMRGIAGALPEGEMRVQLEASARRHLAAALPHVASGDYAGEHWLATFAVLALTDGTASREDGGA